MTDQSHDQPQVETVDVPPNPEILLGWARRLLENIPAPENFEAASWTHQIKLWMRSYEMYRHLPQPVFPESPWLDPRVIPTAEKHEWTEDNLNIAPLLTEPLLPAEEWPPATLTLISGVGPVLGLPAETTPEKAVVANELVAQWWLERRNAPLVLPWPVGVKDLRG